MAKVTIGGTTYEVPELNFIALERSWPFMEIAMTSLDPMKGVAAGISIIAAGLLETDNFDPAAFDIKPEDLSSTEDRDEQVFARVVKFLKRKTTAMQIEGIRAAVLEISKEAGLEPTEGELVEGTEKAPNPLMETLIPSSQSLSPPGVKEEAGAE